MTITKAVNHFGFKLSPKNNIWKATQTDADALYTIMDFVEDQHQKQLNDHHLFAKLYIMVYAQYLEKFKATIFDDIPKKELHKLLDKPLDYFIDLFTQRLNESELYSLFDELNIDMSHPALKSETLKDKETQKLQNALNDKDNLNKFTGQIWDREVVIENLELQINNVINLVRNTTH